MRKQLFKWLLFPLTLTLMSFEPFGWLDLPGVSFSCGAVTVTEDEGSLEALCEGHIALELDDRPLKIESGHLKLSCHKENKSWSLDSLSLLDGGSCRGADENGAPFLLTWTGPLSWSQKSSVLLLSEGPSPLTLRTAYLYVEAPRGAVNLTLEGGKWTIGEITLEGGVVLKHGVAPNLDEPLLILQEVKAERIQGTLASQKARAESTESWVTLLDYAHQTKIEARTMELSRGPDNKFSFKGIGAVRLSKLGSP